MSFKKVYVLLSLLILYVVFADDITAFLLSAIGSTFHWLQSVVIDSILLNIWLFSSLMGFTIYVCRRISKDQHCSYERIGAFILLLVFLNYRNPLRFANVFWSQLRYDTLLSFCSIVCLTIDFSKLAPKEKEKKSRPHATFIPATPQSVHEEAFPVRFAYARSLVDQLLYVDTNQEAFAVGIFSPWGSGKTTFLDEMERKLQQEAYCVKFNPWNSRGAQQIIEDFFEKLSDEISEYYHPLEHSLSKYVKELLRISSQDILNYVAGRFFQLNQTLDQQKKQISEELKSLPKKVFVIIDDIDRLDCDEVFEVLRLIRNTAKFSNVIFIAALDEDYVIKMLQQKGVDNGKEYLEKIFPLEVRLPHVDLYQMQDCFKQDMRKMCKPVKEVNSMMDKLKGKEEFNLLLNTLTSFRKCKLFTRQYAASMIFLYNTLGKDQISLTELLFVELLKFVDVNIYQDLCRYPNKYLDASKEDNSGLIIYKTKPFSSDGKDISWQILKVLFDSQEKISRSSIRIIDNFSNYFCFDVNATTVSVLEFKTMLQAPQAPSAENGVKSIMDHWCTGNKVRKDAKSIYNRFIQIDLVDIGQTTELENYILAYFYWLRNGKNCLRLQTEVFKKMFSDGKHLSAFGTSVPKIMLDKMGRLCDEKMVDKLRISGLLASLYSWSDNNGNNIVGTERVIDLLNRNVASLLERKRWEAVCLFSSKKNLLGKVIRNSVVGKGIAAETAVYPTVLDFFSKPENRSKSYVYMETKFQVDFEKHSIRLPFGWKEAENILQEIFGTTQRRYEMFEEFVFSCFYKPEK